MVYEPLPSFGRGTGGTKAAYADMIYCDWKKLKANLRIIFHLGGKTDEAVGSVAGLYAA